MQSVAHKLAPPFALTQPVNRAMGPQPQKHAEDSPPLDLEISTGEQEKGKAKAA